MGIRIITYALSIGIDSIGRCPSLQQISGGQVDIIALGSQEYPDLLIGKHRTGQKIVLAFVLYSKYKGVMGKAKKRIGRPPMPAGKRRGKLVALRLTAAEAELMESAAREAGLTLSEFLRRGGLAYGKRIQARRKGKS